MQVDLQSVQSKVTGLLNVEIWEPKLELQTKLWEKEQHLWADIKLENIIFWGNKNIVVT